jgi:hypothetical protein
MMDKPAHNNPWADKLQHVTLPEADESWMAMKVILDEELPAGLRRDRRRWFLLILMLLLLIGVCHCPATDHRSSMTDGHTPAARPVPASDGGADPTDPGPAAPHSTFFAQARSVPPSHAPVSPVPDPGDPVPDDQGRTGAQTPGRKGTLPARSETDAEQEGSSITPTHTSVAIPATPPGSGTGRSATTDTVTDTVTERKGPAQPTAAKKDPAPKTVVDKHRERGWVAGIGLNQSFAIGGQQRSNYNSGGTTGGLGDYIPVPMIRYYFSPKLYVQLEAQIHAPQYTKKDLLFSRVPADSVNSLQRSEYIRKLFYFHLPISVHYSPFKNFYAGAGLQFSRLGNGIALFEDKLIRPGSADSVTSVRVQNLKADSSYWKMKTQEFRLLLDVNYNYKKFVLGLRYDRAFSDFLHVQATNTQTTGSGNSALQLYFRYIFFDNRKNTHRSSHAGKLPSE